MTIFAYTIKVAYTKPGEAAETATGEGIRTIVIERVQGQNIIKAIEAALQEYPRQWRPRVIEAQEGW